MLTQDIGACDRHSGGYFQRTFFPEAKGRPRVAKALHHAHCRMPEPARRAAAYVIPPPRRVVASRSPAKRPNDFDPAVPNRLLAGRHDPGVTGRPAQNSAVVSRQVLELFRSST